VALRDRSEFFPPRPDHDHEYEGVLAGVFEGRSADYVATPITSGRKYLHWYQTEGQALENDEHAYRSSREIHVVTPNTLHARKFVRRLRAERRTVIEPTCLDLPHWTQNDYRHLWGRIIQRFVRRIWLMDDWQFSSGCCYEFYEAIRCGIETLSETGKPITRQIGMEMIEEAVTEMERGGHDATFLQQTLAQLRDLKLHSSPLHFKDETLNQLANTANVAQFVSFGPGDEPIQRFCHMIGTPANFMFPTASDAVAALLEVAPERTVNVRSYRPDDPSNNPFKMGLRKVDDVITQLRTLARQGLWTIVNEAIDVNDGGVSGVLSNGVVEFSPDDTPRCVERPGTARLPVANAGRILEHVYGFRPAFGHDPDLRVEFSIHPLCRGIRDEHTIVWEIGAPSAGRTNHASHSRPFGMWPNNFSRFLGDKVYGLLVADSIGASVPLTSVVSRRVAPFVFGTSTGTREFWLRTAPDVKAAGLYPTYRGWKDPYQLMQEIDPSGTILPAVISQESVDSVWSGALVTELAYAGQTLVADRARIEGVHGFGERFMQGQDPPVDLPDAVMHSVRETFQLLYDQLGPIAMEWAFDGERTWVLQLRQEQAASSGDTIVPGEPAAWQRLKVEEGLEALRALVDSVKDRDIGIILVGGVGVTSHLAEVLKKADVPSRIVNDA
jgi:hypothetical protein